MRNLVAYINGPTDDRIYPTAYKERVLHFPCPHGRHDLGADGHINPPLHDGDNISYLTDVEVGESKAAGGAHRA